MKKNTAKIFNDHADDVDDIENSDGEIPLDAEPSGMRPLPPAFAQVLETLLQRLKLNVSPVAEILRADWEKLLPADFAARCRPGKLDRQTLYLYVPDSTALFQLRPQLPRIEAALKPALANTRVRNIRLMIDPEQNPFEPALKK